MPLENFFILHQTGECVFMRNYHGDPLPLHTILGLTSSITMMQNATRRREKETTATGPTAAAAADSNDTAAAPPASSLCALTVHSSKYVYLDHTPYTLVAQGNSEESEQFLGLHVQDVRDLIQTYLGNGVVHAEDTAAIRGIVDLIHHLLDQYATDLTSLCAGSRWVYLDEEVREQLNRLLTNLEESSLISSAGGTSTGNAAGAGVPDITGTMLVLGNSILHSRLPNLTGRMLLHHLSCRPLGATKMRTVPLFFDGAWQHYVFLRLRHLTLVASIHIKAHPLSRLLHLCLEFEEDLVEANLNLPVEEPPVLLRHYTGHDTIAFLYHHHQTGVTVAPPPRNTHAGATAAAAAAASSAAPTSDQLVHRAELAKTLQVFNWFYSRASQLLTRAYVSEAILHLQGYRFYAVHETEFSLFILYTENVTVNALAAYNKEILENVLRHNGALLAE